MPKFYTNAEEILSLTNGNFEDQNILEPPIIIIINYYIIIIIIIIIINAYHNCASRSIIYF